MGELRPKDVEEHAELRPLRLEPASGAAPAVNRIGGSAAETSQRRRLAKTPRRRGAGENEFTQLTYREIEFPWVTCRSPVGKPLYGPGAPHEIGAVGQPACTGAVSPGDTRASEPLVTIGGLPSLELAN
jgi:hypothetical protein